jgi:tetratricopeptide (TPR) repeat protein
VDEVIESNPKSVDGHFYKGNIYLARGDGLNAISEFRTVVNEKPGFIEGYLRLAGAHLLNKEPELAGDTLQNALKVAPNSRAVRKALARVYATKKDYTAAEAQLRKIVELYPDDAAARGDLGDFLLAREDFGAAGQQFEILKEEGPGNALGYLKMAEVYERKNQPEKALAEFEKGYRHNPQSAGLLSGLVQMYMRQGQADEAIDLCEERIRANPEDVFAYNMLGMVQAGLKNYREAESALTKAIEIQPLWPPPHTNLANLYLVQGKKQEAIAKFENALSTNPKNAAAYLSLGLLYERDQDYPSAIDVYERALKENPNFWVAANNLAFLISEYSDQKTELKRAVTLAKSALEKRPGDPAIMDTLAWAYFRLGDHDQARDVLEKVVATAPDTAIFNYHMGMVLYKTGQNVAARRRLEKALKGGQDFFGRDEAEAMLKELS